MKVKALATFETSRTTRSTKQRHITEDSNLQLLNRFTHNIRNPQNTQCEKAYGKKKTTENSAKMEVYNIDLVPKID
jgi:hypothetical protein